MPYYVPVSAFEELVREAFLAGAAHVPEGTCYKLTDPKSVGP